MYMDVLDESEELNRMVRQQQIQEETLDSRYEVRRESDGD